MMLMPPKAVPLPLSPGTAAIPSNRCPHCRTLVVAEPSLLLPSPSGLRSLSVRPEWHCNWCGKTFAPDYFDDVQ
jgi:hypothetical protein